MSVKTSFKANLQIAVLSLFVVPAFAQKTAGDCESQSSYSLAVDAKASGQIWERRIVPAPGSSSQKGYEDGFYVDSSTKNFDVCAAGSDGFVVDLDPAVGYHSGITMGKEGGANYHKYYIDVPKPGCIHLYADDRDGSAHEWIAKVYVRQKKIVDVQQCAPPMHVAAKVSCGELSQLSLNLPDIVGKCAESGLISPTLSAKATIYRDNKAVEIIEMHPEKEAFGEIIPIKLHLSNLGLVGASLAIGAQEIPTSLGWWSEDKHLAFVFAIVFLIALLAIAIFDRNPTSHSRLIYRVILSLAAAGFGAAVPGTLDVHVGTFIRATGAIALFVVVFFFYPKQSPDE